jgi:peptidoglycan L-alanyl-D-glutamate endopeptidase CwlK
MEEALKTTLIDFSIICGYRGKQEQSNAFAHGASKVQYPNSMHNQNPSLAVDIRPYPYTEADQNDKNHIKFKILNNHIKKIAEELDIPCFNLGLKHGWDYYHWELIL